MEKSICNNLPQKDKALSTIKKQKDIQKQISIFDIVVSFDPIFERYFLHKKSYPLEYICECKKKISISAVIITRDEQRCILRCINSILDEVDEIIIVDTGSTDHTKELIINLNNKKIKLFNRLWSGSFSEARNFGLKKASKNWIFFIDSDEYLDSDKGTLKKYFALFQLFPYTEQTIFCPKIIDADENTSIGVERIFRNKSNIKYFGKIHEEVRKYAKEKTKKPYKICVNIIIRHDGYSQDIFLNKKKFDRNIALDIQMVNEEPENPRWAYFYLRDGKDVLPFETFKSYIIKFVLRDKNKKISINNIMEGEYIFALLTIYAIKCFLCGMVDELDDTVRTMNKIEPQNSDGLYLKTYIELLQIKNRQYQLLKNILKFRESNTLPDYGAIHSERKHLDLLIGYLLFETGYIDKSIQYFELVKDIAVDDTLIKQCTDKIKQIIEINKIL